MVRPRHHYKKAGFMLLELGLASCVQGGRFDAPNASRSIARMHAMAG